MMTPNPLVGSSRRQQHHHHHHPRQVFACCSSSSCDCESSHLKYKELEPIAPISTALRARRQLSFCDNEEVQQTRYVIQRLVTGGGSNNGSKDNDGILYVLESILMEQPRKGVSLFLAKPCRKCDNSDLLTEAGPVVVIKAVPHSGRSRNVDDPIREVAALQRLGQYAADAASMVVQMIDCLIDNDFVYLVLPYMSGGDLYSRVEAYQDLGGLPEHEIAKYIRQMAEGLVVMKKCRLAHRDVSLENTCIIRSKDEDNNTTTTSVSSSWSVRIIDMGMSVEVPFCESCHGRSCGAVLLDSSSSPGLCFGKANYLAPEVVQGKAFDPYASDIWSLGICV